MGLGQFLLPALVFLPFVVGPLRTAGRVMGFGVALLAWAAIAASGRREIGRSHPAQPWMALVMAWLVLSIFHPESNSLLAAAAEAGLMISVIAPLFWVGRETISTRRLARLTILIFLVNALSVLVGLLQFYYPGRFDPPNIIMAQLQPEVFAALHYEAPDGRLVLRPCGLSDTPGGACAAGSAVFLLSLGILLQRRYWWPWRLMVLPLAIAGLAIIYFSQVRQMLIVTIGGAGLMAFLFALRKDFRRATQLLVLGGIMFAAGLLWALRSGGDVVVKRFLSLLESDVSSTYYSNRGRFVENALFNLLPEFPIGAGLGRWGMTNLYFGRPLPWGAPGGPIWCEENISAWVVEGGIVMLILYFGGLTVTMFNLVRIIRTTPDPELATWSIIITARCAATVVQVFGFVPFASPAGLTFWLQAAAVHAASQHVLREQRRARQAALAQAAAFGPPATGPPPPRPTGAFPR